VKHNGKKTPNEITTTKVNMQTEVFWTLLVCLLCTIVLELFLISLKIEDWIEVSKIRQDSLDKMQGIKARLEALKTSNEDLDEFMSSREQGYINSLGRESALSRDFLLQDDDQVQEDKFKSSLEKSSSFILGEDKDRDPSNAVRWSSLKQKNSKKQVRSPLPRRRNRVATVYFSSFYYHQKSPPKSIHT